MADEVDDWQSAPTPETDDWQSAQPATSQSEVDDWQAAPAPADDWQAAPLPKAESPFWSGVRKFAHGIGPTLAGAAAGAATMGGYGAAAGTLGLPGLGTLGGTLIGGAAGLVTGGVSGYLASEAQEAAAKALNFDDSLQQAANEQANPGSTLIGGALTAAVPFGMGRGVVTLGQRAFSGALMGGVETGSEYAEGRPFDPAAIALNVGMGAAFPQPRKFLTPFESAGARVGARLSGAPAVAPHGTPGSDAAAGTAKEQPQPAGGPPGEGGAAAATPEATAPGGDRGGPEDYGKEAREQAPDPLDVLDRERAEVGHDPTNPLSRALEDVTSVALPGADELIPSFHWALENGRPDIAEAIVRRLEARVKERAQNPPPPVDPSSSFAPHAERLAQEARQEEAITANLRRAIAEHATNTDPALDAAIRAKMEPEGEAAAPPPEQPPGPAGAAEPEIPTATSAKLEAPPPEPVAPAPATPAIRKLGDIEIAKNPDGPGYVVRRGDDVLSEHDTLRQANARMIKQANAAPADKALPSFYEQQKAQAQAQFAKEAVRRVGDIAIVKNPDGPGYVVMRGDDILSQHNNIGQAHLGLNRAVKQANLPLPPDEAFAPAPAAPAPAPVRTRPEVVVPAKAKGPRARDPETYSLLQYLAAKGGLKPSPELTTIFGGTNPFIPGFGRLIRKTGMHLDKAWEAAARSSQYINDPSDRAGGLAKTSINDLLDLIDKENRGAKQYQLGQEGTATASERDRAAETNRVAIGRAVDNFAEQSGYGEIEPKLYDRTVQIMEKEGVSDPDIAFERALMEDHERNEKDIRTRQETVGDIPGWDDAVPRAAREAGSSLRQAGLELEPAGRGAETTAGEGPRGPSEMGAEGRPQTVIPGAERISEAELAQRRADERLKPTAPQRPADEGLFGDTHLQDELFARKPATPREAIAQRAPGETVGDVLRQPASLGAAATGEVPPAGAAPPTSPPGAITMAIRGALDKLFDIGRDIQMKVAPMATGMRDSMAAAKDFANNMRGIDHDWSLADQRIERQFNPEQRTRIYNAMDEESVMRQRGETNEHMGVATLDPDERAFADGFQPQAQARWARLRELGVVKGEGLPYWTPRMLANGIEKGEAPRALDQIGANLQTTTGSLRQRKYQTAEETEAAMKKHFGEQAGIARDIRVLPLALAKLDKTIAGREFVNKIREIGKATGEPTVVAGGKPAGPGWFHIDHPALYETRVRPRMEEADTPTYREAVESHGVVKVPPDQIPLVDRNGQPVLNYERVPLWIRGDFEGPLRSVLTRPSGAAYQAAMDVKGKTMGLIMNSPLIHNAVEWGRALPAMPGKVATFKVYFEGNRAKNDPATMREAIDSGLVPIGKRFFNQDISSIMEQPNLTPGRSWTSQVLGFVPGLFDAKAGDAVRRSIDRAGDFWHNTLLWDRVGDLQMGLYTNFRDDLTAKGVDPQSSARIAAHWANRYAGALPHEAMSDAARKISNMLLFSRSFTLGNLGAMKDMFNGMPRDVRAQISRDIGSLDPQAEGYIKSLAQRKAVSIIMLDMGLMYLGNSLLQSGLNVMKGDKTLDQEGQGYADRLSAALQRVREHPLSLLQPLDLAQSLSSTAEHEPGKQDRILVGHTKDGTAIYARNPVGKIGEEFTGYLSGPLDMLRRKLGTIARPGWQLLANDKGFGRKVYDPNADTPEKHLKNAGAIASHFATSQIPEIQLSSAADLATGQGDRTLALAQTFGPVAGVTFSKGAPGGPAAGELFRAQERHRFDVSEAMPDIRKMIQNGDQAGARAQMRDLGIPPGLQNFYVRTTLNPAARFSPRAIQQFNQYATPEQRARFQRAREQQSSP